MPIHHVFASFSLEKCKGGAPRLDTGAVHRDCRGHSQLFPVAVQYVEIFICSVFFTFVCFHVLVTIILDRAVPTHVPHRVRCTGGCSVLSRLRVREDIHSTIRLRRAHGNRFGDSLHPEISRQIRDQTGDICP